MLTCQRHCERLVGESRQEFVLREAGKAAAPSARNRSPHKLLFTTDHGSNRNPHRQNRKSLCNAGKLKVCSKLVFVMQQFPLSFFFLLNTFCSLKRQGSGLFLQHCIQQQRIQGNAANCIFSLCFAASLHDTWSLQAAHRWFPSAFRQFPSPPLLHAR